MFGFPNKAAEPLDAPASHAIATPPEPPPDVSNLRVGQKLGNLTKISGSTWVDLDCVQHINMSPVDGCGAEVYFKNAHAIHFNQFGKAGLVKFIDQEQSQISELEKMNEGT